MSKSAGNINIVSYAEQHKAGLAGRPRVTSAIVQQSFQIRPGDSEQSASSYSPASLANQRFSSRAIGLQSVCVVDAGETVLVEGLRVAPWERGKGVAGVLQRFCTELVKQQHPGVKVSRLTRDDKLGPKDFKKYRLITKQ
ncbi:unnamed protein product, partial [Lepidochelys kempii]